MVAVIEYFGFDMCNVFKKFNVLHKFIVFRTVYAVSLLPVSTTLSQLHRTCGASAEGT